MKLSLFGLSHKTAPVQLRERFAFKEDVLPQALQELTRLGAAEAVIVSTCNRVEIAVTSHGDDHPGGIVEQFIETWKGPASAFDGHLYRKHFYLAKTLLKVYWNYSYCTFYFYGCLNSAVYICNL